MDDLHVYLESLRLDRAILDVVLGGRSSIDVRSLRLNDLEKTDQFLSSYGYSMEEPIEVAEIQGIYHESLQFLKKHLQYFEPAREHSLEIPSLFFELTDGGKLLQFAADRSMKQASRRNWSCAILKVMHTIAHLDKDIRTFYFSQIQQQVFDRFYKYIYTLNENVYLGDPKLPDSVSLRHFQTKPSKARESAIIKLLHKQENVSEDLFDHVGVRFVTENRMDALRIVKFLSDHSIIMPFNLKPSRSRNTLVDPFLYRRIWRAARTAVQKESLRSQGEIASFIERSIQEAELERPVSQKAITNANRFSSKNYTSIQFTCRHLIKFRNPLYNDIKKLKAAVKKLDDSEISRLADRIDLAYLRRDQRFFYPYEIQIMDVKSYEEAMRGAASHEKYKKAQINEALRRVLGPLLPDYLPNRKQ